jgi:hypothetical protein
LFGSELAVIFVRPILGSKEGNGIEVVGQGFSQAIEVRMQVLLLVAAVLISIATALASAAGILALLFRLISKLR